MRKLPHLLRRLMMTRRARSRVEPPTDAGTQPSHSVDQLRSAVQERHKDLFDFQIKKGESPEQAYRILNGSQYAQVSGNFIRMFALIEAHLLMVCVVTDAVAGRRLEDKYEFSLKERVKQSRKKLAQSGIASPEKDAALRAIDDIGAISDLRHKMMHWLCDGYAMPGASFVYRNISTTPAADGWTVTSEYSLADIQKALETANRVFAELHAFVLRHAPPEGIIPVPV